MATQHLMEATELASGNEAIRTFPVFLPFVFRQFEIELALSCYRKVKMGQTRRSVDTRALGFTLRVSAWGDCGSESHLPLQFLVQHVDAGDRTSAAWSVQRSSRSWSSRLFT